MTACGSMIEVAFSRAKERAGHAGTVTVDDAPSELSDIVESMAGVRHRGLARGLTSRAPAALPLGETLRLAAASTTDTNTDRRAYLPNTKCNQLYLGLRDFISLSEPSPSKSLRAEWNFGLRFLLSFLDLLRFFARLIRFLNRLREFVNRLSEFFSQAPHVLFSSFVCERLLGVLDRVVKVG